MSAAFIATLLCLVVVPFVHAEPLVQPGETAHVMVGITPNMAFDVSCSMCAERGSAISDPLGFLSFTLEHDHDQTASIICVGGGNDGSFTISGAYVCVVSDVSAAVCWQTNSPATSQAIYGQTDLYGSITPVQTSLVTDHEIVLDGLTPLTTYHCRAVSFDDFGRGAISADMSFTTYPLRPTIMGVTVADTTSSTATITWSTSTPATSCVEYGTSAGYGHMTELDPALTNEHTVVIEGLDPETLYHFRVLSADAYGQEVKSSDQTFVTEESGQTNLVIIYEISVGQVGPHDVTVRWLTNLPTTSIVEYGPDEGYGLVAGDEDYETNHAVHLTSLEAGELYHFRVTATEAEGAYAVSEDMTFETPPSELTISDLTVIEVTPSFFTVGWVTNRPADSQVEYGTSEAYGSATPVDPDLVAVHTVIVDGLLPSSTYHFRVRSTDTFGSEAVSDDQMVETDANEPPPVGLFGITVSDTTTSSATISWWTSLPATSVVEYGLTDDCQLAVSDQAYVTDHEMDLTGLAPGSFYYYRVRSRAVAGNEAVSPVGTFSTLEVVDLMPPQVPSGLTAVPDGSSVRLNWSLSGDPDCAFHVLYRRPEGDAFFSELATLAWNETGFVDRDVEEGLIYVYAVTAVDDAGNESALSTHATAVPGTGEGGRLWVYPNPVSDGTTIRFALPGSERGGTRYTVSMYDARGRQIDVVAEGRTESGIATAYWDGTDSRGRRLASGIYFCVASCSSGSLRTKVMVLR
jgi:hypothetical protein